MSALAPQYAVRTLCQVLDLAPSSYYYPPQPGADDTALRAAIEAIALEYPRYGYRRVAAELRRGRYPQPVNHKRVLRILRQECLLAQVQRYVRQGGRAGHPHYPNLLQGLAVVAPDQVWCADITYIRLPREYVYLAVVLDIYTRLVRGWALSRDLSQQLTLCALQQALAQGQPQLHHSDQGAQYAAERYTTLLGERGVQISMSQAGCPTQNAYAERWMRTLKEEEVYLSEYASYPEAHARIGHFIETVYNRKRVHSSLGYLTPAEFAARYQHPQEAAAIGSVSPCALGGGRDVP